jgi:hypothetical protein
MMDEKRVSIRVLKTGALVAAVLALFLLASCGKADTSAKQEAVVKKVLDLQQVKYTDVQVKGSSIEVTYEASEATGFDNQLIIDWGTIFGTLAEFPYDPITIVNTINGQPTAKVTTTRADVHDFLRGVKNESQFWESVDIEAVK